MRTKPKRHYTTLVVICVLWLVLALLVVVTQPGNLWWEAIVITVTNLAVFLTIANLTKSPKWGVIVTIAVVGGLTLNRLGILNTWSAGGLLVILGLCSLIK